MIVVELIDDCQQLQGLRGQWDDLLEASSSGTVFQSCDWIGAWWHHFGSDKKLFALAVRTPHELIGLALFMVLEQERSGLKVRSLHFAGERGSGICPDHLDVIASPGTEVEVAGAVVRTLLDSSDRWDEMAFSAVAQESVFYQQLVHALQERGYAFACGVSAVVPFLALPPTRKHKNWVAKSRKLSRDFEVRLEYFLDHQDIRSGLEITRRLVGDSARRNDRASSWDNAAYFGFHRDVATALSRKKAANVTVLFCNDSPVAVYYGYVCKDRYLMYSTGCDSRYGEYSVGQVIVGKLLDHFARIGIRELDFLRGAEEYKYRWTDSQRENRFITVYGRSTRGRCLQFMDAARNGGRLVRGALRKALAKQ